MLTDESTDRSMEAEVVQCSRRRIAITEYSGVAAVSILGPWGVMRDARCAIQAQGQARRHAWLLVRIAPGYLVMHTT